MVRITFCAFALILSSCKAAKPELIDLLKGSTSGSTLPSTNNSGNGRMSNASSEILGVSANYKIRSRVAATPQNASGTSTNYRVRGHVEL